MTIKKKYLIADRAPLDVENHLNTVFEQIPAKNQM